MSGSPRFRLGSLRGESTVSSGGLLVSLSAHAPNALYGAWHAGSKLIHTVTSNPRILNVRCRRVRSGQAPAPSTPSVATKAAAVPAPTAQPNDFAEYMQLWSGLGEPGRTWMWMDG